MRHQEIYQLLKYRRQELCSRLQSIKNDFSVKEDLDDVLYHIAHDTKVELADVKSALEQIEDGSFGICENCGEAIDLESLKHNPLQKLCSICINKS
jgi:DnaK suppressor protein|tara:strand:+ start:111 stop:398 length:288 start_codon:yes stop_codon:yes gene_type:complete